MMSNEESKRESPGFGHAAVIGAGIAGLSAAIALRRAGWHVEMFERSEFKNEIGAAITVTPNATLVLDRWGFDKEKAAGLPNLWSRTRLGSNPAVVIQQEDYTDTMDAVGHGIWAFHRVDLHRGLRDLASCTVKDDNSMGPPVEIRLGCQVTGVDWEQGVVQLAGSQKIKKDLVILADGAQSRLISNFTGKPSAVRPTGRSVYRWLVPMDAVNAVPDLRVEYEDELLGYVAWLDPVKNVFWVTYRCRGGNTLNNAVVHDTQAGQAEDDLWHSTASKAQVLAMAESFPSSVREIVTMANEDGIKVHHLYKRPALTTFVRGRTAVVGDAAHVMMPTHAAGAGIAIESAAALEVLFRGVYGKDALTVRHRLELFDKLRIPRCNLTMLASNAGPEWLKTPGVEEEIRKFYSGPLPPAGARPYSKPFREVLFHHDEYRAAELALAQAPRL